MKNIIKILIAGCASLTFSTTATAQTFVLSDNFLGDEDQLFITEEHSEFCFGGDPGNLVHREVGPIQVSTNGSYEFRDAGLFVAWDTVASIHEGPVNVNNPEANLVGLVDDVGDIALQSGVDYYVVAQPFCLNFEGVRGLWGFTITGDGVVIGTPVVKAQDHWTGEWDGSEELVDASPSDFNCEDRFFRESGPHQVDQDGTLWLAATSAFDDPYVGVFLGVYDQTFDPDRPRRNQVGWSWDGGPLSDADFNTVKLETGKDYWFVVQPGCQLQTGEYQYTLFPPRPYEFNPASSGVYFDRMTPGQGELFEFHPPPPDGSGFVFGAWFTWTTEQPPASTQLSPQDVTTQEVGDARQRWLTMQGTYQAGDDIIELDLFNTMGGVFNDPTPVETAQAGTATLEMENCRLGVMNFNLDNGESGSTVVERVLDENVEFCEGFFFGPTTLTDEL